MRRPLDSSCPRIARAWTQWMPYRAGRYRGIRIDMPGFGASTAPDGSIRSAGALVSGSNIVVPAGDLKSEL